jgi:hypothetical protein
MLRRLVVVVVDAIVWNAKERENGERDRKKTMREREREKEVGHPARF